MRMNYLVPILNPSEVPTIDVTHLHHQSHSRSTVLQTIQDACQNMGFFQVINHGISQRVIDNAMGSLLKFFDLSMEEKNTFLSDDVAKPVRFGTSTPIKGIDQGRVSRDFIKLYAYPLQHWIGSWPHNPTDFRESLGKYATEVRRLGIDIMGAIEESLGLSPSYFRSKLEQGMHMIVGNRYSQCSPSSNTSSGLGLSSHTDHSVITILVENISGLEIMDFTDNNAWKLVPAATKGTLSVLVGNHLEVLSNGVYKSVFHRVTPSPQMCRVSIGSFASLAMEEIVEPALELVDEEHPPKYRATSLHEFVKFIASKQEKPYLECLKI